jgi:hypothetical protein
MQGRIHSIELLEMALAAVEKLGYRIREDSLDGFAGGACQLKGQKWLVIDPALASRERLELVIDALAADPGVTAIDLPAPLVRAIRYVSSVER